MTAVPSSSGVQGCGVSPKREHGLVGLVSEDELVAAGDGPENVGQFWIDQQHVGAAVLHYVGHLVEAEPEVDGHEYPAVAAHTPRST